MIIKQHRGVSTEIFPQDEIEDEIENDDPAPGVRKLASIHDDAASSPAQLKGLSLPRVFFTRIFPARILHRHGDKTGEILKQDRTALRPDNALRRPLA
jgi:hypothetical protein